MIYMKKYTHFNILVKERRKINNLVDAEIVESNFPAVSIGSHMSFLKEDLIELPELFEIVYS